MRQTTQTDQLTLAGFPAKSPDAARDHKGKFRRAGAGVPVAGEVATVARGEFLAPITLYQFPNFSKIILYRSQGQGLGYYDLMLGADADLAGFFQDLNDDVLKSPWRIAPADQSAQSLERAAFAKYALDSIPQLQNCFRHFLSGYARGFSVTEKIYTVADRGKWQGAVMYSALQDKPQRWFGFDFDRNLRFKTTREYFPGELVDQNKFIVSTYGSTSSPWGTPILDLCYWCWFAKHHAMRAQAIFFSKWASPTVVGKYKASTVQGADEANKKALLNAMDVLMALQNDNVVAMPQGIEATLLESARNGTISFETYIDQLTKMESRIVTGQVLAMSGDKGGSYALGKVHENRLSNKVDMLGAFLEDIVNRFIIEELIDRNFGPQEVYPKFRCMSRDLAMAQAYLTVEQQLLQNGHGVSKAWGDEYVQNVAPLDAGDTLVPSALAKPGQVLPVPAAFAGDDEKTVKLAAPPKGLHEKARSAAKKKIAAQDAIAGSGAKRARPAIKKVVKAIAAVVKKKKTVKGLKRRDVYAGVKGIPGTGDLGQVFDSMMAQKVPTGQAMAAPEADSEEQPPDVSDAAKIALALQVLAIADRIIDAAKDAPEETAPADFAGSLTDPNGLAIDKAFGNMFDGTHSTNVASVATARLRAQLQSSAFRKKYPYIIIVTKPNARATHRAMDGFVISSEDARFSPFLPPYGFGCDCVPIPVSAELAKSYGLTGAAPTGDPFEYAQAKGLPSGMSPGVAEGFQPAFGGTDAQMELYSLRQKAEEIRAEDPQAWAELHAWLLWLFGYDVLRKDPPPEEMDDSTPGGVQ